MSGTAIFGGTFDPVHFGHLETIKAVCTIINPEKVLFIPAKIPPFKTDKFVTPDIHRVAMLKLALENYPGFDIDTYELGQEKVSYTINTLEYLKGKYNNLYLIIGFDNYLKFDKWYRYEEILNIVNLVVLRRKSETSIANHNIPALFAETPLINVSSTEIRAKVANNEDITGLVPDKVAQYVKTNNLYKADNE